MANALYDKAREKFLNGAISWSGDTIKMVLVDVADYTVDLANHEFLSSIPAAARVATSAALTGKTYANGVANANNPTFTSVTGDPAEAVVIYKETGDAATSPLIAYIDNAGALTVTPNGNDIPVLIDTGSNKLFKL
ncbi:hypothetical protein [uncultured Methanobacterium sp.]|uniref:hypothetical protein n=1 Tax=uncultured Methanobacterium sp. TaxID=176306 RepID=UPI002AA75A08|nr:hypothetical protein [uncultured Methanobacterium sp.]